MALSDATRALIRNYTQSREWTNMRTVNELVGSQLQEISISEAAALRRDGIPVEEDAGKLYRRVPVYKRSPYIHDQRASYVPADIIALLTENAVEEGVALMVRAGGFKPPSQVDDANARAQRSAYDGTSSIYEQLRAVALDEIEAHTSKGFQLAGAYEPVEE